MNKKTPEIKIGGGLEELEVDVRDFSRDQVFGSMRADELPDADFMVAPIISIRDQGDDDTCTARATNAASEDQEEVELDDYFTFYAIKVLVQKSPASWGADLRSACLAHVKHGALEEELGPFHGQKKKPSRDTILDPKNYIEDHFMLAYEHRKTSFFAVDGPHDTFDNIRAALWMHREKKRSVIVGTKWRRIWTHAENGAIENREYGPRGSGHAFIFKGQRIINGEAHLVAQLSNGEEVGDRGLFFFPRSVVNKEFGSRFGMYMFVDLAKETVKNYMYYGIKVEDNFFLRMFKVTRRILSDLFNFKK